MPGNAIGEKENERLKFNWYKMPVAPNNTHDIHPLTATMPVKSMIAGYVLF
jgi:hypothetical protein